MSSGGSSSTKAHTPARRVKGSAPWVCALLFGAAACGAEPLFPADWAAQYEEVRGCRRSGDHDLLYVRILADPSSSATYAARSTAFPVGSVLLKVEHADQACSDVTGFTAMRRESAGYAPDAGDWRWQKLGRDRTILQDGKVERCASCHRACGVAPDGHDWTCAAP